MNGRASGRAEAKINLGLRILGRRDDGFHDIRSIFHSISLADEIDIALSDSGGVSISVEGGGGLVPADGTNLACRAAAAFMDRAGLSGGVSIRILKRIPAGGGLGGGSSDAACTLRLMRDITGLDPGLFEIASSLGSDVPFLLTGGAALEIQHLSAVILERVNRFFGWQAIGRIAIRQAPLRRREPSPAPKIDDAAAAQIAGALPDIKDDNLRQALGRLGSAIKGN